MTSLKKKFSLLLALLLSLSLVALTASGEEPSDGSVPPDDALVTYGYMQSQLDALRKELSLAMEKAIEQAVAQALNGEQPDVSLPTSGYHDLTLPRGSVITLGKDAEVIFRGGHAVILTPSDRTGEGVTNLATGLELFSGMPLSFGHIYHKTTPESSASLLVTGEQAAFTLKGTYAIS